MYIEGALQTRKWTDQAGVEKYSTEVVLQGFNSTLTMLEGRCGGGGGGLGSDDPAAAILRRAGQFRAAPGSCRRRRRATATWTTISRSDRDGMFEALTGACRAAEKPAACASSVGSCLFLEMLT